MKLVDILARELKVWPDDAEAVFYGDAGRLAYFDLGTGYRDCLNVHPDAASEIEPGVYRITRAQWQAAVDALKAAENAVPEWNGEGLPPVGTMCEYQNSLGSWFPVEITAIAKKGICFVQTERDGENYVCQVSSKFRPIRTPEQIAAENRIAGIQSILDDYTYTVGPCTHKLARSQVERLYDAGYRKFEIVDN